MTATVGPFSRSSSIRVAWFYPTLERSWRWQPIFKELARHLPGTEIFTGSWTGFIPDCLNSFSVQVLSGVRFLVLQKSEIGSGRGFFWVPPRALRRVYAYRPDVIVVNGFNLCAVYSVLLKKLIGSKIVLLWQGVSPETQGMKSVKSKLRRLLGRYIDLAICNTHAGVDYLREETLLPEHLVVYYVFEVADPNCQRGVSGQVLDLPALPRPVFLFVGRMIKGKGVHKLLEACHLLRQKGRDEFSLLLVGEGIHKQEFTQFVETHGLARQVFFEGPVRFEDMGRYYRFCDVLVLPSLEDTWGVVALEAMGFGRPVICSREAGIKEIIQDGRNGFVFDPSNPEELAERMQNFMGRPEIAKQLGEGAAGIAAQYTPAKAAQFLAAEFRRLAAARTG